MKGIFLVEGSGKLLCDGRPDQHQDQDRVQQSVDGYDVVFDYRLDFDITCRPGTCGKWDSNSPLMLLMMMMMMMMLLIIMLPSWGLGQHCVPTPKMAYFSVFKAFLFLKYF